MNKKEFWFSRFGRKDINNLLDKGLEGANEIFNFYDRLNDKIFSRGDVNVDHRKIYHWERHELLWEINENREWRRYSLVEYMWLKIIQELRSFNVGLDFIRNIKSQLIKFDPAFIINMMHNGKDKIQNPSLQKITKDYSFTQEDAIDLVGLKNFNPLTFTILQTIIEKVNTYIFIKKNFTVEVCKFPAEFSTGEKAAELIGILSGILNSSAIVINIYDLLREFMASPNVSLGELYDLNLLTNGEMILIDAYRNRDFDEIVITPSGKDQRLIKIKNKKDLTEFPLKLVELIKQHKYQDIQIKTVDGRIVYLEQTEKIKL